MNYGDTPYVRLYIYDTVGWLMMTWEARATLPNLMRKLDRAGVLDLAEYAGEEMARAVAALIKIPEEVVGVGLADLLKRGTVVLRGQFLVMPNYVEGQSTPQSDRLRKAESRARYRDHALAAERGLVAKRDRMSDEAPGPPSSAIVTSRDEVSLIKTGKPDNPSENVTDCPGPVTKSHSDLILADLNCAEQRTDNASNPADLILAELKAHPSLAPVAYPELAKALATRFATNEIAKGFRIEWVLQAIRDSAADFASVGLNAEALGKKVRVYCDNARPPRSTNGKIDAPKSYESPKLSESQRAQERKRSDERLAALEAAAAKTAHPPKDPK